MFSFKLTSTIRGVFTEIAAYAALQLMLTSHGITELLGTF